MVCPACLVALAGTDGIGGFEPTPAELYGTPVALAAMGAGLGALIDKKNRKRGTLIGLLSGAIIGVGASVVMASMSAKPAAAGPPSQTQNAATADQVAPVTGFAAQKKKKLRALTPAQTTTSVVTSGSADPNDILMNYKPPATVAPPAINYVR